MKTVRWDAEALRERRLQGRVEFGASGGELDPAAGEVPDDEGARTGERSQTAVARAVAAVQGLDCEEDDGLWIAVEPDASLNRVETLAAELDVDALLTGAGQELEAEGGLAVEGVGIELGGIAGGRRGADLGELRFDGLGGVGVELVLAGRETFQYEAAVRAAGDAAGGRPIEDAGVRGNVAEDLHFEAGEGLGGFVVDDPAGERRFGFEADDNS